MAEIHHLKMLGANLTGQRLDLLMRQLQELVDQAQLAHQFKGRRVDCVAAGSGRAKTIFRLALSAAAVIRLTSPETASLWPIG